ncbi:hypothetical protein [Haladaptatus sp. DFWS20]
MTRSRTPETLRLAATRGFGYRGRSATARVQRDRDVTPIVSATLSGR